MANRAYLATLNSSAPVMPGAETAALCAASYMLPLFWLMLFDETCVVEAREGRDGSRDEEDDLYYPYLITPCAHGLARSVERLPLIEALIGREHRPLFDLWFRFLQDQQNGYFHCETLELAWMTDDDPDVFPQQLGRMLGCFRKPPRAREDLDRPEFADWAELLRQAQLLPASGSELPISGLCGYAWSMAVPWEPQPLNDFAL